MIKYIKELLLGLDDIPKNNNIGYIATYHHIMPSNSNIDYYIMKNKKIYLTPNCTDEDGYKYIVYDFKENIISEECFKNNKLHGTCKYFIEGSLYKKIEYIDGLEIKSKEYPVKQMKYDWIRLNSDGIREGSILLGTKTVKKQYNKNGNYYEYENRGILRFNNKPTAHLKHKKVTEDNIQFCNTLVFIFTIPAFILYYIGGHVPAMPFIFFSVILILTNIKFRTELFCNETN